MTRHGQRVTVCDSFAWDELGAPLFTHAHTATTHIFNIGIEIHVCNLGINSTGRPYAPRCLACTPSWPDGTDGIY